MRHESVLLAAMAFLALNFAPITTRGAIAGSDQTYTSADVSRALEDARRFAQEGKYEQALERHIWYHKNALKYDEAQSGVRLSFALAYWVELGAKYPRALHELRAIRNDELAKYRKSPTDMLTFDDVVSIDFALSDLKSAKSLFYENRTRGAGEYYQIELRQIVASGDLKWAKDVLGDPVARLTTLKSQYDMNAQALSGRKEMAKEIDDVFVNEISDLVAAVTKVNGVKAGVRIQKKAYLLFDSPEMRRAITASASGARTR